MSKKVIYGFYDDDHTLLEAARKIRQNGVRINEVYSPFPIHGIDGVIGVPRTRLAICAFIYGLTGLMLALWMMKYMMVDDWPVNIGGKPNFALYLNLPAFIPVAFESTVLCAAHGMALTFLLRSWVLPGVSVRNPDPRTTNDRFVMAIEVDDQTSSRVNSLLKETGSVEIK